MQDAWLDGEIIVTGDNNVPGFQALQNAFENADTARIVYYLFDLPYLDGHDLRGVRLDERRKLLQSLLTCAGVSPGGRAVAAVGA